MSPINAQAYLRTDAYRAMLDQIVAAPANPGLDLRTTLIEILGDAGIWPLACLEDRLAEKQRRRARGLKNDGDQK